ncbi:aspartic proteinase CDR1-like [Neltuma alba]|uniref:aspartic proteinase CDR1-like n=1 Tax=Neltuma alba TaxID=207710 RepID=UPI0010A517C3|nr:aspartic proteinase CDR1-like [Prosopis alba]
MLPHSLAFALILFLSTFFVNVSATNNKLPKGFSIDLIHRDLPLSPFFNSSMTHSERAQNVAPRSLSRANRFERWALADTGSDLIWFQRSPCPQCYPQNAPFLCGSDPCKALPPVNVQGQLYPKCGTSNECAYFYSYRDKSYTMGELSAESVSFGQAASFPKTVFGCGHNNGGSNMNNAGLVGLGQGSLSLVSQMGNVGRKFSYCLPPHSSKTTTKLRFGEEASISGNGVVSTPLITT